MEKSLKEKLKILSQKPGVYFLRVKKEGNLYW